MEGIEQGNEMSQENESEARFKEAIQGFESAEADAKAEALNKAREAAETIEDEEKKSEALAQVEQLSQSL